MACTDSASISRLAYGAPAGTKAARLTSVTSPAATGGSETIVIRARTCVALMTSVANCTVAPAGRPVAGVAPVTVIRRGS